MDVGISGANLKPSGNESTMCTEEKQGLLRLKFRNRMTGRPGGVRRLSSSAAPGLRLSASHQNLNLTIFSSL